MKLAKSGKEKGEGHNFENKSAPDDRMHDAICDEGQPFVDKLQRRREWERSILTHTELLFYVCVCVRACGVLGSVG